MSEHGTRERILDVAEKLFSENGFDGTSLRMITAEADVNLAAVHYHFGSKERLLHATLQRRIAPVNAERLRRLDAATDAADPGTPPVEAIVDAFVRPTIEAFSGLDREHLMGMLRIVHSGHVCGEFFAETFAEVIERFSILADALPHLTREETMWRFRFMVGSMMHTVGSDPAAAHVGLDPVEGHALADAIVAWATAGFRAPAAWPVDGPGGRTDFVDQESHS